MSLLADNISAIEIKNRFLAKSLEACGINSNIEIVLSKQDIPVVKYNDNFLSSKYNPKRESSVLFEDLKNKNANYIFIFGIPNSAICEVFNQPLPNQKFIIFEPSIDILKAILTECDLKDYLKKENIYIFNNLSALDNFLQEQMIPGETFEFAINASYKKFFLNELKNFVNIVKNVETMKSVHASTLISYGSDFARQNLLNVFNFNKSAPVMPLHNRFKNIPAIIVSPGPSLAKNVKHIREMKNRAIIISTAPALAVMKKWDIKPNFVNAIETQNYSYQIKKFEDFLDETYLLLLSQCHNDFFNIKCRGIYTYFTAGEKTGIYLSKKNEIFNKGIFASGGSVSTDAFFSAYFFGCSPIIMAGQDLAISGSKNYSMFTLEEDAKIQTTGTEVVVSSSKVRHVELNKEKRHFFKEGPKKQIIETKGLFQKQVYSKTDYFTFKAWFENTARNIIGRTLYNSTEGGVFIDGFEHLPLSAVIKEIKTDSKNQFSIEKIDEVYKIFKPSNNEEIKNFLKGEKLVFKNIKAIAEKLFEGFLKAQSLEKKGKDKEASFTLSKTYKKQNEFSKKIDKLTILESFLEEDILRMELIKRNIQSLDKNTVLEGNLNFLKKTINAAQQIVDIINEVLLEGVC